MIESLLVLRVRDQFEKRFGCAPHWVACAPGRVNLIGEHTDYNDGFVLPMAIERHTVIAAAPAPDEELFALRSDALGAEAMIRLSGALVPGEPGWANYAKGVIAGFQKRRVELRGLDMVICTDIPLGGGLSSSAALEVAVATILEASSGQTLAPMEKAKLCQQAEIQFAGLPCGIMDQCISVMARADHAMLIDCRSLEVDWVPMLDPAVSVLILNTRVTHELAASEYAARRRECEAAAKILGATSLREVSIEVLLRNQERLAGKLFKRALHVISENDRTLRAAAALRGRDWERMGQLMYESHNSLRDDYEVSCRELDIAVEIAQDMGLARGVYGCRMTGGGFGGCVVALVERQRAGQIADSLASAYQQRTGMEPAVFQTRPSAGARMLP